MTGAIFTSQNGRDPRIGDPTLARPNRNAEVLTGLRPVFVADTKAPVKVRSNHLNFFYGDKQALYDINLDIREKQVSALIGPSGSGKTTFLRIINRMSDVVPSARAE